MYEPKPIDTAKISLTDEVRDVIEALAENAHDVWAAKRMADGWTFGATRDDTKKLHPRLIPYSDLPESEKEYDRAMATDTIKVLIAKGFFVGDLQKKIESLVRQAHELTQVIASGAREITDNIVSTLEHANTYTADNFELGSETETTEHPSS